jgi:hypothetical protein
VGQVFNGEAQLGNETTTNSSTAAVIGVTHHGVEKASRVKAPRAS